jgi:hypothetical protein
MKYYPLVYIYIYICMLLHGVKDYKYCTCIGCLKCNKGVEKITRRGASSFDFITTYCSQADGCVETVGTQNRPTDVQIVVSKRPFVEKSVM